MSGLVVKVGPGRLVGRRALLLSALTWRQRTFSSFLVSRPSKEGTGFQLENDTFQSNLIDIEMTVFRT